MIRRLQISNMAHYFIQIKNWLMKYLNQYIRPFAVLLILIGSVLVSLGFIRIKQKGPMLFFEKDATTIDESRSIKASSEPFVN